MLALAEAQKQEAEQKKAEERMKMVQALREESRIEREDREKKFLRETQTRQAEAEAEAAELVPELAVSLNDHVNVFTDKLMAFGER